MDLIKTLNIWTEEKLHRRLLRSYGGTQVCPWCCQIVQKHGDWSFKPWDRDPMLDVVTCGPCGGTSLWRFEIGFIYIGPLEPPSPKHKPAPFYSIEAAKLKDQADE
jgi:hypothetical protein